MRKQAFWTLFWVIVFLFVVLVVYPADTEAAEKPANYMEPHPTLQLFYSQLPDTETRVGAALEWIRGTHPDWKSMYRPGKFDCGEMTEYVRYMLKKCGIRSYFHWSKKRHHAWVSVPTETGDRIAIEATELKVIKPINAPDLKRNILGLKRTETDWWNSIDDPFAKGVSS